MCSCESLCLGILPVVIFLICKRFAKVISLLICYPLEFFGTRILFYVFWFQNDSWTWIVSDHPDSICCISAVWISSSVLAQHCIRPERLSDPRVPLSDKNCVKADWMREFCLCSFILLCSHSESFGTRLLFYVCWFENGSWTRFDAEHRQGWMLNILILLYISLNLEFWLPYIIRPLSLSYPSDYHIKCHRVNVDWMWAFCWSDFTANLLSIGILWDEDTI